MFVNVALRRTVIASVGVHWTSLDVVIFKVGEIKSIYKISTIAKEYFSKSHKTIDIPYKANII